MQLQNTHGSTPGCHRATARVTYEQDTNLTPQEYVTVNTEATLKDVSYKALH
jgi:hypothetical protein